MVIMKTIIKTMESQMDEALKGGNDERIRRSRKNSLDYFEKIVVAEEIVGGNETSFKNKNRLEKVCN